MFYRKGNGLLGMVSSPALLDYWVWTIHGIMYVKVSVCCIIKMIYGARVGGEGGREGRQGECVCRVAEGRGGILWDGCAGH